MMNKWIELLTLNDSIGIKKLIKSNANINECDDNELSILANALKLRVDADIINILIDNGANVKELDDNGLSILDYAVSYSNISIVKKIIKLGDISPNSVQRKSKFSPLMGAVCYSKFDIVKYLIEIGADKDWRDQSGLTAIDFARKMKKIKILEYLQGLDNENSNCRR